MFALCENNDVDQLLFYLEPESNEDFVIYIRNFGFRNYYFLLYTFFRIKEFMTNEIISLYTSSITFQLF